jgi:hypothetical protein
LDVTQNIPQSTAPAPKRPRRWPRRVALGVAFAVALGIGAGIGAAGHSTGISQITYNASQAHVSALRGQVSSLNGQVSGLQTQVSNDSAAVTTAQDKAATAQQTANANAAAGYKNREAALSQTYRSKQAALAATYQGKEAALAQKQRTANQDAATLKGELGQVQANTISTDGVYVVGQDIKSGTWHTGGDGGSGDQCYFATLNSTDTSNIADNNNFDGPETVDVSGAYAFQISGACTWVLVP